MCTAIHCVKKVRIRSFSGLNAVQKNSEYGQFPRNDKFSVKVNSAPYSFKVHQKTLQNKSFRGAFKRSYSDMINQVTVKPSRAKSSVTVVFPEIW